MTAGTRKVVLVLGGGPDSEREVSLKSAKCVADALAAEGSFVVERRTIDRISADELAAMPGDVIFPVLHGGWGEGGPLQDLLEHDGRSFVGSGAAAARHAMDKIATKFTAAALGIRTPIPHILDLRDTVCPLPFPVIVKPVHEGSTVGLYVCEDLQQWGRARQSIDQARASGEERVYMIEPCILGPGGAKARELTVGLIDDQALPIIEIKPAEGLYDFEAKYTRDDTQYVLDPVLPPGVAETIKRQTVELSRAMHIRHLARADFMLDAAGLAWFLEINTIPGFTDHSLVPMAGKHIGLPMPALCARLVSLALRGYPQQKTGRSGR